MDVGLDGVESLLLKFVGGNLVHQTDAATLLLHIDDHALALLLNHLKRLVQLLAAVAAQRAEDVASGAAGMDANQHGFVLSPLTLDKCHVFQSVAFLSERYQLEMTIAGRHIHTAANLDERLLLQPVGYQVPDTDNLQMVYPAKLYQFGQTGHRAVVVHDFHQCAGRIKPRQFTEVDGCFRMTRAAQHAIVLGVEGVNVTWTAKGLRCGCRVGQRTDGGGTVVGRDTGGAAFQLVNGNGEGGSQYRGVVLHLMGQVQFFATADGDGGTEYATGIFQHEVHHLRRYLFSGTYQVALVFAVFIVNNNDELSLAEIVDGLVDGVQFDSFVHIIYKYTYL